MLRWGIVGFGWVARGYMAAGIVAVGDRIVAVCDPDPAARTAAAALGATTYPDVAAMLGERLDAVYVATPNHLHRSAVELLLAARVPVLCEKPLAATLADAEAMVIAARRHGTLLGIAFDQRHHPAHRAVRDAVEAGIVGRPTSVRIVYACWVGRDWTAGDTTSADNWRVDRERAGGGATLDLAPHGLDLAEMLVGEPIVDLHGYLQRRVHDYDVDDGGMLVGRTAGGILVSLHIAYNMPETLPRRRLEVAGTRGLVVATDTMGQDAGGRVIVTDAATGVPHPLAFDDGMSPFAAQARAFAAAVRGEPHDFDPDRGLAAQRLLSSISAPAGSIATMDRCTLPEGVFA